ncbi:MAG: FAD-dependent oxidoreductase [Proteobacteria bacterium]|nr:FAD-dependent oxidoreductase [Pseudomonadota bacterium]
MNQLPEKAQVVIVGGGVIGCAIAYHLTKIGIEDVLLLERKELTCGTTWHAAGLVGKLRGNYNVSVLAEYSTDLYCRLPEETGIETGVRLPGALNLADHEGMMTEYRRLASLQHRFKPTAEVLSVEEIAERWKIINTDGLVGGVYLPEDGQADPVGVTNALAKGAKNGGATIIENCAVTGLHVKQGRVCGVKTTNGDVAADTVVLAAGMWTRELAQAAGVTVPLHACEHYYIITEPISDLPKDLPTMRDVGSRAYFKEDAGKILVGCFEEEARPWGQEGIREDFSFDELPGDFEHFEPILEKAIHRLPLLETAGIRRFFCGPESFTPDDRMLIGPAPELDNLYIAAGLNSIGIQTAGGIGLQLAQWIKTGLPPRDLGDIDIARTMSFQRNRRYLQARVTESLGLLYSVHWPYKQVTSARMARLSPLHYELQAAGACFGEAAGWERPNWFDRTAAANNTTPQYQYSFGRQNWFAACGEECRSAQMAGVIDLSSFAKYKVCGADACRLLNRVCANNVDVEIGRIVYTPWLNQNGGIEADLTVTRLAADEFLVLSGVMSQRRDLAWLRRQQRADEHVVVNDMTSAYANIGLFGKHAAAILSAAGSELINEETFAYGCSRQIECGYALVQALRLGYIGEAGFELIVPTEFAVNVYRALMTAGEAYAITNVGLHAVDSLRMEKARRHFGDDLTSEDTPLAAGLGFAVAWDKPDGFIGREALLAEKGAPRTKRLLQFSLIAGAEAPLMFGDEPIFYNGVSVGGVSSAAYGHRIAASLALGYVHHADGVSNDWCAAGTWEIEIAGERHAAQWHVRPPYDTNNAALQLNP